MPAARPFLPVLALLFTGAGAAPEPALSRAVPNDNRTPAGVLRDSVLTVALEATRTMWHPDGDTLPGLPIEAFSEAGKDPTVPGPLLRVPAGTEIRVSLRNTLERDTITVFLPPRVGSLVDGGSPDRMVVPPGEARDLRLRATNPGTYLYRATTGSPGGPQPRTGGFLSGAFIVDSAGGPPTPADRILVLQNAADSLDPLNRRRIVTPVMAINGRSWPHTERLHATVGDSLSLRVVNASSEVHPMHLHGFYYRVDALDMATQGPTEGREELGRRVVTQRMPAFSTMSMTWVPERPGNWLFHCHFQTHIVPHDPLGPTAPHAAAGGHVNHALTGMNGLVIGIHVRPRPGERVAEPGPGKRRLRLVAIRDPGFPDSFPSMRFVLEERGARPLEAVTGFSPTISLTRGEPVSIMVVNRLTEPTAVHWHGIELESYYDGVAGFGGSAERLTPVVAPRDSFEVRFTPPRAGTFIYHSHVDEPRQHRAGLVGALIVRDPAPVDTAEDRVFFLKSARAGSMASAEFEFNGKENPDTTVLRVGHRYRLRFVGLQVTNPNAAVSLTARPDSILATRLDTMLVQWRPWAKDGADLPDLRRTLRPARQELGMGETYDFEFLPARRGELRIEVRVSVPRRRLMVRVPIRVE